MAVELMQNDLAGPAAKLDGLELTEAEQAILDGVLDRAAAVDEEVSGFAFENAVGGRFKVDVDGLFIFPLASRLADSVGVRSMEAEFTEEE